MLSIYVRESVLLRDKHAISLVALEENKYQIPKPQNLEYAEGRFDCQVCGLLSSQEYGMLKHRLWTDTVYMENNSP